MQEKFSPKKTFVLWALPQSGGEGEGGLDSIAISKFADILVALTNTAPIQIQDLSTPVLVIEVPILGLEIWDSQNLDIF